jgi:hypothetical protein
VPSLAIWTLYWRASWASPTPSEPAMESPTSSTLTDLVEVVARSAGVRYEGAVVVVVVGGSAAASTPGCAVVDVVEDGPLTLSCDPCSSAAPTGTRVLTKIALMAAAAPMGAATQERLRFSAPRRTGISTRS